MANSLLTNPLVVTADLASYQAAQTLTAQSELLGLKVKKFAIVATAATAAGTVSIVDPVSNTVLLAPVVVAASLATGTVVATDDFPNNLTWADFKVTGLTATNTELLLWYGR